MQVHIKTQSQYHFYTILLAVTGKTDKPEDSSNQQQQSRDHHEYVGPSLNPTNTEMSSRFQEAKSLAAFSWTPRSTRFHSNRSLTESHLQVNYPWNICSLSYLFPRGSRRTDCESRSHGVGRLTKLVLQLEAAVSTVFILMTPD